jgi:uncharacterized protein YutE (UPF0331/DUF86 family)
MANVRERVAAEIENIEEVLGGMPSAEALGRLSGLELAGVAALLHSFYNGVENVLKQVLRSRGEALPSGPSWHRDLVDLARRTGILSEAGHRGIRPYVAFRHFFSHGYACDLDPERLAPLVHDLRTVYETVKADIYRSLDQPSASSTDSP